MTEVKFDSFTACTSKSVRAACSKSVAVLTANENIRYFIRLNVKIIILLRCRRVWVDEAIVSGTIVYGTLSDMSSGSRR